LIYLVLEQERFSEYDAHYFPSLDIPITRLSEPKNYSDAKDPKHRTVLCAELPCSTVDPEWTMTDSQLGSVVSDSLKTAGIPIKTPILQVLTRRLEHAYPIYKKGFEHYFNQIHCWLSQINNLLSFGRQGLFAHDNTHHALFMGYCAANCICDNGRFDSNKWESYKRVFDNHVVED
jgi:protoporphyrinogen oxidase